MLQNDIEKFEIMIDHYQLLRKEFKWDHDLIKHLIALSYVVNDRYLNVETIHDMKDYIKGSTSAFSPFRGQMQFTLSGLLSSSSSSPKTQFDYMVKNEKILKSVGFKNHTYLPTALYALSNVYEGEDVQGFCEKAMDIYKDMRSNHPFLTSGDDYALAILLADAGQDTAIIEAYYKGLNEKGFFKSNGLQMLSHILALGGGDIEERIDKCAMILKRFKASKLKIYQDYYSAIGLITLISDDHPEVIQQVIDGTNYLRKQKYYNWLGKGMNIMLASAIITSIYIKDQSKETVVNTALNVSIQVIIAAQQAAMIAAISASTAASVSTTG